MLCKAGRLCAIGNWACAEPRAFQAYLAGRVRHRGWDSRSLSLVWYRFILRQVLWKSIGCLGLFNLHLLLRTDETIWVQQTVSSAWKVISDGTSILKGAEIALGKPVIAAVGSKSLPVSNLSRLTGVGFPRYRLRSTAIRVIPVCGYSGLLKLWWGFISDWFPCAPGSLS